VIDPIPSPPSRAAAAVSGDPDARPAVEPDRREFLKRAAGAALGGCAVLGPAAAGTMVLLAPLRQKSAGGTLIKVAHLENLALGGPPQLFQVRAERTDAWTKHPVTGIGLVFLQRTGEKEVRVLQAACPHLGCAVEFRSQTNGFFCPCHNSGFAMDGQINDPNSPSLRPMDSLGVEIRAEGEVWVRFQNFVAGIAEKTPVA
jgi:Rieske Fe-S protein